MTCVLKWLNWNILRISKVARIFPDGHDLMKDSIYIFLEGSCVIVFTHSANKLIEQVELTKCMQTFRYCTN